VKGAAVEATKTYERLVVFAYGCAQSRYMYLWYMVVDKAFSDQSSSEDG